MKKYHFTRADKMDFIGLKYPHSSMNCTNIITSNETNIDGNVENTDEVNANYARKWVDENHM